MRFEDKVALLVGAASGPSETLAAALAAEGARVALVDVHPARVDALASRLRALGAAVQAHVADASNKMALQAVVHDVLAAWERVDLLVCGAAVRPATPLLRLDEWEWDKTLAVNLKAAFLAAQTVGRAMRESGGGVIVNLIADEGGGTPGAGVLASRAGLIGLTLAAARELGGHGIRVHLLVAGSAATDWPEPVPVPPPGLPTALPDLILHLCSDAARDLNGLIARV